MWDKIGGNFSDAIKKASTGDDGKQYFVPLYNYPWARASTGRASSQANGYEAPKTLDELVALASR